MRMNKSWPLAPWLYLVTSTVTREGDTDAYGDGINAVSTAVAAAEVDSDVTQTNTNSASATTSGTGAFIAQAPVDLSIPFTLCPVSRSGLAFGTLATSFDGGQSVVQENVNEQLIAAGSLAISGDVTVSSDGYTSADGIGINAVSSATAGAKVDNGVTQSNSNTLSASTQGDLGLIDQSQEAEQVNENLQLLVAGSAAISGDVSVESKGDTDAGGNGIVAASTAIAGADLDSSVTQTQHQWCEREHRGDLTAINQTQELEQENVNLQGAAAVALAEFGLGDGGSAGLAVLWWRWHHRHVVSHGRSKPQPVGHAEQYQQRHGDDDGACPLMLRSRPNWLRRSM